MKEKRRPRMCPKCTLIYKGKKCPSCSKKKKKQKSIYF